MLVARAAFQRLCRARDALVAASEGRGPTRFPGCFGLMGLLPTDAYRNFREASTA